MIAIIEAEYIQNKDQQSIWACWLEITQAGVIWLLPATAPGTLEESELQAHFDANEAGLWKLAQVKKLPVNYKGIKARKELRDFLIANPGARQMIELTPSDLETAITNRTAAQETLLLKTLAFAVRFLYRT